MYDVPCCQYIMYVILSGLGTFSLYDRLMVNSTSRMVLHLEILVVDGVFFFLEFSISLCTKISVVDIFPSSSAITHNA